MYYKKRNHLTVLVFIAISWLLESCVKIQVSDQMMSSHMNSLVMHDLSGEIVGGDGEGELLAFLFKHVPYKQVKPDTKEYNKKIGRVSGGSCEVLTFAVRALEKYPDKAKLRENIVQLADWITGLQISDDKSAAYGGVPSTPDLPYPSNSYYYTADAAFCGEAMFEVYDRTQDKRHLKSALRFASFIKSTNKKLNELANTGKQSGGFCEYVVLKKEGAVWNCDVYTKNLIALPVLKRATDLSGDISYMEVARNSRSFLVSGLAGAWEFANFNKLKKNCKSASCGGYWSRIKGPKGQRDYFVYGDTLAYGLRGLFQFEGGSKTVQSLYIKFSSFKGKHAKSKKYDGRIAFAGYMKPKQMAPDEFSAYYDLVTLGILHSIRNRLYPSHFRIADSVLKSKVKNISKLSWRMDFDLTTATDEYIDLVTIANLGQALL
ncbi:MAG: hypothetical protein ACRBBN_04495 [Methyloligellaceae bacterium]